MTAQECKRAIAEKKQERASIQEALTDETLPANRKRALRLEDARIAEDINTLARVLRDMMPSHHVAARSGGWNRMEQMTWNEIGMKTWRELEAETNSEDVLRMMQATRETMNRCSCILSEKQNTYFSAVGQTMERYGRGSKTQKDVSADAGVDRSTVNRTVQRARGRIQREAKLRYEYLKDACENGGIRMDVSDRETMEFLLSTLSERQLLYMTLYYGNWMTTREVGKCLGVDHSTVARTIGRGLERLSPLVSNRSVELSGVPELEMRIMECLNQLPPEPACHKPKSLLSWKKGRLRNPRYFQTRERDILLRRDMFLTVLEHGKLGELLRRERGISSLILRAVRALKEKIRKKG